MSLTIFSGVTGCPRVTRLLSRDARVVAASDTTPPDHQQQTLVLQATLVSLLVTSTVLKSVAWKSQKKTKSYLNSPNRESINKDCLSKFPKVHSLLPSTVIILAEPSTYSRLPITRTFKGNFKRFELSSVRSSLSSKPL